MTSIERVSASVVVAVLLFVSAIAVGPAAGLNAQGNPSLEATVSDDEVTPGTETTITVTIGNDGKLIDGNEADRSVVTTARSVDATLRTRGAPMEVQTATQYVGTVTESEPATADFEVVVPESADPGTYSLEVTFEYSYTAKAIDTNSQFINRDASDTVTRDISITVSDDARFDVTEVDSKLYVGEEGRIAGRLRNVGGSIARNAEVKFTPTNENINALSSTVAVGDISAGESVPFSIPVEVTSGAEAVPHRFDLNVDYRDENGISQSTDDPEFLADIETNRDAFLVEPINNTIPAGGSRPLDLRVTNNLNETVTDIEGKFFADDPLDSTNDETFTGSLDPGETTTVTVDLSASGGATIKNYPASIDFRYVDREGDSKLTDSYQVAISVTEPETGGGPPVGLLVGLLVVLAGGGFLAWRRGVFSRLT